MSDYINNESMLDKISFAARKILDFSLNNILSPTRESVTLIMLLLHGWTSKYRVAITSEWVEVVDYISNSNPWGSVIL